MLGMYGAYWAHEAGGVDPYVAGLVIVPFVFVLCLTVLRGFVLWLVRSPPLIQVFATLGLSIALQNLALVLWGGNYRSVQMSYSGTLLSVGSLQIPLTRLVVFRGRIGDRRGAAPVPEIQLFRQGRAGHGAKSAHGAADRESTWTVSMSSSSPWASASPRWPACC